MVKIYRLTKTGKMQCNRNGSWINKWDYDECVRENRFLKKDLTFKNFTRMFATLLENERDIPSEVALAANIYLQGIFFLIESAKQQKNKDN